MDRTLHDVWQDKIVAATDQDLVRFIFVYKLEYYCSEWRKARWCEPFKVRFLN